eukprot:5580254-Prymnesium_polylepis.1
MDAVRLDHAGKHRPAQELERRVACDELQVAERLHVQAAVLIELEAAQVLAPMRIVGDAVR